MNEHERSRQYRMIESARINCRITEAQAQRARRMVDQGTMVANPFLPTNI